MSCYTYSLYFIGSLCGVSQTEGMIDLLLLWWTRALLHPSICLSLSRARFARLLNIICFAHALWLSGRVIIVKINLLYSFHFYSLASLGGHLLHSCVTDAVDINLLRSLKSVIICFVHCRVCEDYQRQRLWNISYSNSIPEFIQFPILVKSSISTWVYFSLAHFDRILLYY